MQTTKSRILARFKRSKGERVQLEECCDGRG